MLNIIMLCVVLLNVVSLSVNRLNGIRLPVIRTNVVVPMLTDMYGLGMLLIETTKITVDE
jgi:hypothetical protein